MDLKDTFQKARAASAALNLLSEDKINEVLLDLARRTEEQAGYILAENARDLARKDPTDPMYDRLRLSPERLAGIVQDIRHVAALHSPVGEVLDRRERPNGMKITKVRVPFGVVGVIYEARPNVSFDVFSLCFKTANACVLKGGSDAEYSNEAIVGVIREVLAGHGIDPAAATLLPADREATAQLLGATGLVDLLIPRGSASLIRYVRENAHIPVIETGAGICHTYFDRDGDADKAAAIVLNAKTRRVSVCNALDCLVVHADRLADLAAVCAPLAGKNVVIYADRAAFGALEGHYPAHLLAEAGPHSFGTEFLDYKMAVKTVASLEEALAHIAHYSSGHSEAIVTENTATAAEFQKRVDAACVYVNVSTAFTDGGQFGFGAEIGISTQKLHARGPMALPELTSYKYLIEGNGQVRD